MATLKIPRMIDLLEMKDIVGFSADYLMQNIYQLRGNQDDEIIYTICSNLYRAERSLEIELIAEGLDTTGRIYNPQSFRDVSYLDIKIDEVVEDFIEKHKDSGTLDHFRNIL